MATENPDCAPNSLLRAAVPRYTSYPTAVDFHDGVGEAQYREWLSEIAPHDPLSVYIHIPFCDKLCWFCGCHTKQIKRYDPISAYLKALHKEIALVRAALGRQQNLHSLHLGGGSPSLLAGPDLKQLRAVLNDAFRFDPETQVSVEIDPSDMGPDCYGAFQEFGITRASIGVQDFNKRVQIAINRPQTFQQTSDCARSLRAIGITSLNLDALYGLPHQSVATVAQSLRQVISLRPDRIALFGYAHVPWLKKHQRMIPERALPGPRERLQQASAAEKILLAAGYQKIGIDHFALPNDELAAAAREGILKRNFQGYTADNCQTLLGLGASSISSFPTGYVQNDPATGRYIRAVGDGRLPVARGIVRTAEDQIYADVIEQLMCHFSFSLSELASRHGSRIDAIRPHIMRSSTHTQRNLTQFDGDRFSINEPGRHFARAIAASFDPRHQEKIERHSVAV